MASPNKRKGKKQHGRFGKGQKTEVETQVKPVSAPVIETPEPALPAAPVEKKKRSFFSKDKE
jgi:hypothetical protein